MMLLVYLQAGENNFPGLEVKATHLDNHNFRVEVDGMIMDVSLAVYTKVNISARHSSLRVYLDEMLV